MADLACRFCGHGLSLHNLSIGCGCCTCMATPGEGNPRTEKELNAEPIRPDQTQLHYVARTKPTKSRAAMEWLRSYNGSIDSTALLFAFNAGRVSGIRETRDMLRKESPYSSDYRIDLLLQMIAKGEA